MPEDEIDIYKCKRANIIEGDIFGDYKITDKTIEISRLLSPLSEKQVPSLRCVGMNYIKHALELKMDIPKYPVVFFKPTSAITGPCDPILVPSVCQIHPPAKVDYEVELVIVIGKEGKDITVDKAHEYIMGYTIGNDVSQRTWQMERGGTQFGVGKMFDSFAPIGPAIVSPSILENTSDLRIYSMVNNNIRQDSNTSDMIFNCKEVVAFMSIGTTLRPGDLIFTGTPSGVAVGIDPPPYLRNGDEVYFHIDKIGNLRNKVVFDEPDQSIMELYT